MGENKKCYGPVDFFPFLGHIDHNYEPFLINAFLGSSRHLSGHVYFLLILGQINQSSGAVYFQVFFMPITPYIRNGGFSRLFRPPQSSVCTYRLLLIFRPQRSYI